MPVKLCLLVSAIVNMAANAIDLREMLLNGTVALISETKLMRNEILEKEIKPLYTEALEADLQHRVTIVTNSDHPYKPPTDPDGKPLREVDYTVRLMLPTDFDISKILVHFNESVRTDCLPHVWAYQIESQWNAVNRSISCK